MGFVSFTFWPFAALGALRGARSAHHSLAQSPAVSRRAVGGDGFSAASHAAEPSHSADSRHRAARSCGPRRCCSLAWRSPGRTFHRQQQEFDDRQPLHAVLVIDNSLSMAYESLEGSLLEQAKERARQFIEQLPAGSRVTLIPACGTRARLSIDPYDSKESAHARRSSRSKSSIARPTVHAEPMKRWRPAEAAPELAKRVVFIGDQQELNWRGMRQSDALAALPAPQIVDVGPTTAAKHLDCRRAAAGRAGRHGNAGDGGRRSLRTRDRARGAICRSRCRWVRRLSGKRRLRSSRAWERAKSISNARSIT